MTFLKPMKLSLFQISIIRFLIEVYIFNLLHISIGLIIFYLIDIFRLTWIEDNLILTASSHPIHISIFVLSLIIFPLLCVLVFNIIYKKLGISGY